MFSDVLQQIRGAVFESNENHPFFMGTGSQTRHSEYDDEENASPIHLAVFVGVTFFTWLSINRGHTDAITD